MGSRMEKERYIIKNMIFGYQVYGKMGKESKVKIKKNFLYFFNFYKYITPIAVWFQMTVR